MFSFFRKDKPEDLKAFLKEAAPGTGPGPSYNPVKAAAATPDSGIEVQEAVGGLPPELEEAAVLYANGKVGETAALLNRYLLDQPENRDPLPWFMLFDLYEASNQASHFEDTAVEFAIRFERSPPSWSPRNQPHTHHQAAPAMVYGERYGTLEKIKQAKFFEDVTNAPFARLDVSRAQAPDEESARAMLEDILRLEALKKPVELMGGPGFGVRLDAARQGGRLTESGWFLLMAVLQLMGKEQDFDNVAVDYAVSFEVSPPSYTPPRPLPKRSGLPEADADPSPETTFELSGIIGPGTETQLIALKQFAKGKPHVEIDLSKVVRIDFALVGMLLETLIEIAQSGCRILFKEGNELINTLLQIVGASQFATVMGRSRL